MHIVFAVLFLSGCSRKSPTTSQLRAITSEIVSAAQRVTARKTEVTIRPELGRSWLTRHNHVVADDIYASLESPTQAVVLENAIAEIARRHGLTLTQTSSSGVIRIDLALHGNRTHTIHIVTPLVATRSSPPPELTAGTPELAIIIDDLGRDLPAADSLLALSFPLTVSVLPHLQFSADIAEEAYRRGDVVMLHLPMESEADGAKPEDIELHVGMYRDQIESTVAGMLATVPHAVGVNNHQGSRATADAALMDALMPVLHKQGLFFIDSRTTAATLAYDAAQRAGVPAASRKVFLDDVVTREAILSQLELAARDARRDGSAIAIGHPHAETIAALSEGIPRLEAGGIRLVFASDLVH